MVRATRTALYVLLVAWSLLVIFIPDLVHAGRFLFVPLSLLLAGDVFIREWRSGNLHKTLAEIARRPPRTDPLEFLAVTLASIAVTMTLSSL